ncbi:hypothetical protein QWZ06_26910 [Chryseobacterium tructae]|uniref:Uncharacterized protein n=1 Tax=Chryseobacterium tructae TaxID=1037380 RepID=A0ABV7XT50_9FLAO|nr:hypothetical protein [Chryseobacterium tructae]MDN3695602.1 hypothetical protein [Chryseobacterium tructae]
MKKIYTLLVALSATLFTFAQVPEAFSYQAIAFNSTGSPVANGNVSVRISILNNSVNGSSMYTETHTKTTNSKGLVNLNIGQGTPVSGSFSGINWAASSKFIKVEMDPAGGTNYTNVGTNQLMAVPYAMVANKVNVSSKDSSIGDDIIESKSSNYYFLDKFDRKIYAFNSKTGIWSSKLYNVEYTNNNITPTISASNGNIIFTDKYERTVNVFNSKTGNWSSQLFNVWYYNNGHSSPEVVTMDNGNVMFIDKEDHKVYTFNYISGTWSGQEFNVGYPNNNSTPTVIYSGSNFGFVDKYEHSIKVFNSKTMEWKTQEFSIGYFYNNGGLGNPEITANNGNFMFTDKYDHKVYVFNSKTGNWVAQEFNVGYFNNNMSVPTTGVSETK